METRNRIDSNGYTITKSLVKRALRVLFLFLFSVVLFPQAVHAINDQVIELNEDYDVQSLEVEELEESEESEESEKSHCGISSNNRQHITLINMLTLKLRLLYNSRLQSNQKRIYTPPPEFC